MIEVKPEKLIVEGKSRDTDASPSHAVQCDRRRSQDGRAWHHWSSTALCGTKTGFVHPYIPYAKSSGRCPRCETIVRDLNYDIQDAKMMKKVRQGLLGLMIVAVGFPVNAGYSVTRTVTREPIVVTATAGDCACSCVVCDCCTVKKTITRTRAANLCRCKPATEIVKTRTVIR